MNIPVDPLENGSMGPDEGIHIVKYENAIVLKRGGVISDIVK